MQIYLLFMNTLLIFATKMRESVHINTHFNDLSRYDCKKPILKYYVPFNYLKIYSICHTSFYSLKYSKFGNIFLFCTIVGSCKPS